MAPTRLARTTWLEMARGSTIPLPTVAATGRPRRKAMKLKKAAQTTATRGLRTRVDTTVAMELAASWKPFMKSKARATRTMKGTIPSWFKKLDCFSFQSSRPPDQDFASFRIFDLPPRGRATGDLGPGVPPGRECCAGRAQPVRTASQRGSPGLPPDCVDLPAGASPPPPASCEDAYRLVRHRLNGVTARPGPVP